MTYNGITTHQPGNVRESTLERPFYRRQRSPVTFPDTLRRLCNSFTKLSTR